MRMKNEPFHIPRVQPVRPWPTPGIPEGQVSLSQVKDLNLLRQIYGMLSSRNAGRVAVKVKGLEGKLVCDDSPECRTRLLKRIHELEG